MNKTVDILPLQMGLPQNQSSNGLNGENGKIIENGASSIANGGCEQWILHRSNIFNHVLYELQLKRWKNVWNNSAVKMVWYNNWIEYTYGSRRMFWPDEKIQKENHSWYHSRVQYWSLKWKQEGKIAEICSTKFYIYKLQPGEDQQTIIDHNL